MEEGKTVCRFAFEMFLEINIGKSLVWTQSTHNLCFMRFRWGKGTLDII